MRPYDLVEYNVMNEPRVNRDLMDVIGNDAMLDWWRAARKAHSECHPAALFLRHALCPMRQAVVFRPHVLFFFNF